MDDETRKEFAKVMDDMIAEANKREGIALELDQQAETIRASMEALSESSSSSRVRRGKAAAADLEVQRQELLDKAAKQRDIISQLWLKIHEMQEKDKN